MAGLTGSSSPHFYLARSRSSSLPPLSSSGSSSGTSTTSTKMAFASFCSSLTWPNHVLPSLALAFDEPSFFADLRVDINPITATATAMSTSSTTATTATSSSSSIPSTATQSLGTSSPEECCSHSRLNCNAGLADDNRSTLGEHGGGEEEVTPRREDDPSERAAGRDCVWVHRMVIAVHSPVFRSLLRHGAGGARESREGVVDMRGPQHPPGRVVRCMLKMMYASPGLAIDELGHEPKLSDEWEFLLQLYKLAHLYQVEVVLDACTRRLKHILERKDYAAAARHTPPSQQQLSRRGSKAANHQLPLDTIDAAPAEISEEDEEKTRQTCYALELLAFLLHVKQAETCDSDAALDGDNVRGYLGGEQAAAKGRSVSAPEPSTTVRGDDSGADDAGSAIASNDTGASKQTKQHKKDKGLVVDGSGGEAEEAVDAGEQREELLVRMLDYHLYPQLAMIVQHIRCEDVLTLQHLLHLSVCRPTLPSSPTTASLTPQWPGHATIQRTTKP